MHPALQRRRRHLMMTRRSTRRGSRRRGLATFLLVTLGVFGLMFAGSVFGTAGGLFAAYGYFASDLPEPDILEGIEPYESTEIYDRTGGTLLARFECQNREAVSFAELPDVVWQATVSSEDRTFWENNGVDFQGVVRAALVNLEAGEIVQGASTITQQVIDYAGAIRAAGTPTEIEEGATPDPSLAIDPLATPAPETTEAEEVEVCEPPPLRPETEFEDKIKEQILAMEVTEAYPGRQGKERILETYLNLIFYGNGSYGIKAAAANYFGTTDLATLSLAQAAFLAALPQAPSFLDPYIADPTITQFRVNPAAEPGTAEAAADAIRERDLVLGAMLEEGYITRPEYREATATTWEEMGPSRVTTVVREPHFAYRVRTEAEAILASLGAENPQLEVRTGGYTITTTLDYELQQAAHGLIDEWVANLGHFNVNNSALVAINSGTGEIVTYIGSVDYNNTEDPRIQGQFDVAGLGLRQPGSAFKPITYTSAFRSRDATPSTMLVDTLTEFGQLETSYRPTNADIKEHGPVLAIDALRYSLNIPSVQMQALVTPEVTAQFAEEVGIAPAAYLMGQDPGLTLTLGSVPVSLTNMTQAYGVFAQQGAFRPATTIQEIRNSDNRIVYSRERDSAAPTQPLTPAEAYLTHWILEGNTDPARNVLWGERARLLTPDGERRPAGFKTGTTDDFRDVSGYGYVPGSLVTGVWMGNNNQEQMSNQIDGSGLFSADGPLFLWQDFMEVALNQPWQWNGQTAVGQTTFDRPAEIQMASVCRWSGMAATGSCGRAIEVPFLPGTVPPADNVHARGCLDLVQYVTQAVPDRPQTWIDAAQRWSDRTVNRDWAARGDPAKNYDPNTRYQIAPLYGESGFPAVCGRLRSAPPPATLAPTPTPTQSDGNNDTGSGGGGNQGGGGGGNQGGGGGGG